MSHHFLLPKTITKTIQLFSELKKQKKIKSKFFPAKNPEIPDILWTVGLGILKTIRKWFDLPPPWQTTPTDLKVLLYGKKLLKIKLKLLLQTHFFEFRAIYRKK